MFSFLVMELKWEEVIIGRLILSWDNSGGIDLEDEGRMNNWNLFSCFVRLFVFLVGFVISLLENVLVCIR